MRRQQTDFRERTVNKRRFQDKSPNIGQSATGLDEKTKSRYRTPLPDE